MVAAYLLGGKTPAPPHNRPLRENATLAELAKTIQTAGGSVNLKLPEIYAKVKS
jgi:hypothetical protein